MSNTLTTTPSTSSHVVKGAAIGVVGVLVVTALDNFMGWGLVDKLQTALPKKAIPEGSAPSAGTGDAT